MNTIVIEGGPGQKIVAKDSAFVAQGGQLLIINGGEGAVTVYFPQSIRKDGVETEVIDGFQSRPFTAANPPGEYAYYVYEDAGLVKGNRTSGETVSVRKTRSAELLHSQPRIVIVASSQESTG